MQYCDPASGAEMPHHADLFKV
ncbi:hypothetical protein AZE42_10542 [Rhizopogon vesiculosus]|uniref:Uncharacterized protein n=1 Tax=Rhizopogon vesiculosus TaxID=180088 RepID=A0A1J8PWQ2_9AGAM|nr:hypothetical protein AZE42_10542 [Rhizopogon vesiculosus]